jgi:hypothetical protein
MFVLNVGKILPNYTESHTAVFSTFYTGAVTFSSKQLLSCTHGAEWTPFQTHYFIENLVAPRIEPRPLDLQPGTLTTRPQRTFTERNHR